MGNWLSNISSLTLNAVKITNYKLLFCRKLISLFFYYQNTIKLKFHKLIKLITHLYPLFYLVSESSVISDNSENTKNFNSFIIMKIASNIYQFNQSFFLEAFAFSIQTVLLNLNLARRQF